MKFKIKKWIPLSISTLISCFWAVWGILENFHEGWYLPSLAENLGLMVAQYLSPMLVFMILAIIAINRPRVGAVIHATLAVFSIWFFRGGNPATIILISSVLLVIGILYWFSSLKNKKLASRIAVGLPLLALMIAGISPIVRVSQRSLEINHSAHYTSGNGNNLIWAPSGPGWPDSGKNWPDANDICSRLNEIGTQVDEKEIDVWRLPTIDETVRSMMRHGENSGGVWDSEKAEATYTIRPDKEAPLWDIQSPVIYWWTATEIDENTAWMIEYDGQIWPRKKTTTQTYFGFRCVRNMEE